MTAPSENVLAYTKPEELPKDFPHPLQMRAREERSAFAVAYGLFYLAGFLFGLLVGWLLWRH